LNPPEPEEKTHEEEEGEPKVIDPHDRYKEIQKIKLKYLVD